MENITVYIRPVETLGGFFGAHMYAVYTNSSGQQYSLSGWRDYNSSILVPFGAIDTQ